MKTTDRIACPECNMFTWAHEMIGKVDGVHVCGACAMRYVRRTWSEHELPNAGLHLVYSEAEISLPAEARKRHAA